MSIAWDPELKLLAVGTKTGALRLFEQAGVELSANHDNSEAAVTRIVFIPGQGRLVTVLTDKSLHMWEVNNNKLEEKATTLLEGRLNALLFYVWNLAGNVFGLVQREVISTSFSCGGSSRASIQL